MDAESSTCIVNDPVLEVKNLAIAYKTRKMDVNAVRGVSFQVCQGETLGIVGESGCGKSTIAMGLVGFLGQNGRVREGSIHFQGENMVGRPSRELRKIRGNQISMVFQDPTVALNPSIKLGTQLKEVLTQHHDISDKKAHEKCVEMLKRVQLPDAAQIIERYPHQLSGGQQQRVVIAMALLNNPSLLIMDEPTTALDVTVEARVLDLVNDLKRDFDAGIVFISHNLGVVARVCDYIAVMYAGIMVEKGPVEKIFARPLHPYTRGLLNSVPKLGTTKLDSELIPIPGNVPAPGEIPEDACIFHPRCAYATDTCIQSHPDYMEIEPDHIARCFYADKIYNEQHKKTVQPRKKRVLDVIDEDDSDTPAKTFLKTKNMKVYYPYKSGSIPELFGMEKQQYVKAVDDITVRVREGETLGIVGESGCGKSTLVKGIIGLEDVTGGGGDFLGFELNQPLKNRDLEFIREMQMVFQNPDQTLNPSYPVGYQIARPIRRFKTVPKSEVYDEVIRLLRSVRLEPYYYARHPRQLSGGEKQRVGIARALASRPDLVILDEPLSALDVSVQASVINLLLDIQDHQGTTMIFIAHDLSVVRFLSDDVAVMYLGQIIERGPAEAIYAPPYHPYTEALLSAVPIPDPTITQKRIRLTGNVPSAINPPSGCRFHTRCPRRDMLPDGGAVCEKENPPWRKIEGEGHYILCHIPLEELAKIEPIIHKTSAD